MEPGASEQPRLPLSSSPAHCAASCCVCLCLCFLVSLPSVCAFSSLHPHLHLISLPLIHSFSWSQLSDCYMPGTVTGLSCNKTLEVLAPLKRVLGGWDKERLSQWAVTAGEDITRWVGMGWLLWAGWSGVLIREVSELRCDEKKEPAGYKLGRGHGQPGLSYEGQKDDEFDSQCERKWEMRKNL